MTSLCSIIGRRLFSLRGCVNDRQSSQEPAGRPRFSCYPFGRSLAIEPLEDRRLLSGVTLTPSATLTGLDDPQALAFDSSGNLYVADYQGAEVSEFTPGSTTPTTTFTGLRACESNAAFRLFGGVPSRGSLGIFLSSDLASSLAGAVRTEGSPGRKIA